jgi:heme exporter protein A
MSVAASPVAVGAVGFEARGLAHRYGTRRALERIDFTLEGNGVTAVTGANGSGKSTLLRIIAGLLRPSEGEARLVVDGRTLSAGERRGAIGLAAPEMAFYEELSVGENLRFAAEARALSGAAARVSSALQRVGLATRAADRVAALSSGMQQRLRVAFAILHAPPLLLLDEPGGHLDDEGRAAIERVIAEHARNGHVLLATNDEREWRLAGRRIPLRGRGLGDPA